MAEIEVLGYCLVSSVKMVDFVDFCINGSGGSPGVFEWLHSRNVPEAHFFTSAASDLIGVFGATVQRLEAQPVPWMGQIMGFDQRVTKDGELGQTNAFPQLTATVTANKLMDAQFAKGVVPVMEIREALKASDRSGFSFSDRQFTAALSGNVNVDRVGILAEIENKLGKPLFDKPDLAAIRKSLGVDS